MFKIGKIMSKGYEDLYEYVKENGEGSINTDIRLKVKKREDYPMSLS